MTREETNNDGNHLRRFRRTGRPDHRPYHSSLGDDARPRGHLVPLLRLRDARRHGTIKVSDGAIASPYSKAPDIVCALNAPAVDKFESSIKPGGWLFINDSLVPKDRVCREDINVVRVPMSEIAVECGNPKGANLVLLGAVAAHTGLFKLDELEEQVTEYFARKGKINPKNSDCLYAGAKL